MADSYRSCEWTSRPAGESGAHPLTDGAGGPLRRQHSDRVRGHIRAWSYRAGQLRSLVARRVNNCTKSVRDLRGAKNPSSKYRIKPIRATCFDTHADAI